MGRCRQIRDIIRMQRCRDACLPECGLLLLLLLLPVLLLLLLPLLLLLLLLLHFGGEGLKIAGSALAINSSHESRDMGGRSLSVTDLVNTAEELLFQGCFCTHVLRICSGRVFASRWILLQ